MERNELGKALGFIAALAVSYAAAFWLFTLPVHSFSMLARMGWMSALYCAMGVGVYFWAAILAPVAKNRMWSARNCQMASLIAIIPGAIFLLVNHPSPYFVNTLLYQYMFTGFLLTKLVHPDFYKRGPFERNPPTTLFPK